MPNKPDVNKVVTFVRVPVELMARLKAFARDHRMTITQAVNFILHERLDSRPLSLADIEWIKQEIEKNEAKRQQ